MATANDLEQLIVSSVDKGENSSSEIEIAREPLIKGEHQAENYSIRSAVLPFLFPAFGGLLYGYDIGATSSATISIEMMAKAVNKSLCRFRTNLVQKKKRTDIGRNIWKLQSLV